LNASNAVVVLYFVVFSFWYWCACEWGGGWLVRLLGGYLGALLIVFSFAKYWRLWRHKEPEQSDNETPEEPPTAPVATESETDAQHLERPPE
jgi:hypothetical protein